MSRACLVSWMLHLAKTSEPSSKPSWPDAAKMSAGFENNIPGPTEGSKNNIELKDDKCAKPVCTVPEGHLTKHRLQMSTAPRPSKRLKPTSKFAAKPEKPIAMETQ